MLGIGLSISQQAVLSTGGVSLSPKAGDMVFGPQANMGVGGIPPAGQTVTAGSGYETLVQDYWLPSLPAGWAVAFTNFWGSTAGTSAVEVTPGNTNEISWASVFSDFSGSAPSFLGDVPFQNKVMANGGFILSDALPAVAADGGNMRFVIKTPGGGKRSNGYGAGGLNVNARIEYGRRAIDENTGSPTIASKRTSGVLTSGGTNGLNNGEGYRPAAILIPMTPGYRSFLLGPSTSILAAQEVEYRWMLSYSPTRNAFGFLPVGLDDPTNGRMGWGQFAVHSSAINETFDSATGYQLRKAMFDAIAATRNGGRNPFTDMALDFRNDVSRSSSNKTDVPSTVAYIQSLIMDGKAKADALHPGTPKHIIAIPPMFPGGGVTHYATDVASQATTNPAIEFRPAAIKIVNQWLRTNWAALGFASFLDVEASFAEPGTGLDYLVWRISSFNKAGAGTLNVADYPSGLASGTNLSNGGAGLIIDCADASKPPLTGEYIVFEPGTANVELLTVPITTVALVSGTRYTVKLGGTSTQATAKAHAAGAVVKTTMCKDSIHPSKRLHDLCAVETVIPWKATLAPLPA